MTSETRYHLLNLLSAQQQAEIDQAIMDSYLSTFASRAEYESDGERRRLYFLAVLATAEYHEHWERTARPLVVPKAKLRRFQKQLKERTKGY